MTSNELCILLSHKTMATWLYYFWGLSQTPQFVVDVAF